MPDTPYGMPRGQSVVDAAADILATTPVPDGYPATGRAMPHRRWVSLLRRAGWPVETVEILAPQHEHRGPRAGQRTADAPQPVSVVPLAWLRLLAARLGVPIADACRGIVRDD